MSEHRSDAGEDRDADDEPHELPAIRYDDGTLSCPGHPRGRGGGEPVETIDLSERTGRIVTWTIAHAPPPGVREPNPIAIVAFDVDGDEVRTIGQLTTGEVAIGDAVRPVYEPELRDPEAGIREPDSQEWDGFRFAPTG